MASDAAVGSDRVVVNAEVVGVFLQGDSLPSILSRFDIRILKRPHPVKTEFFPDTPISLRAVDELSSFGRCRREVSHHWRKSSSWFELESWSQTPARSGTTV